MPALRLALHFIRRDIRNRYLGSFSGGLWALLQPLAQLAVYGFVFVYVFKAKVPGADAPGYVPFLALALWPWTAFAEGLSRATTAIQDNAALIRKVALPREILVFSAVAASFLIQGIGFLAIVLALRAFGVPVDLFGLPQTAAMYAQLFALALGFAFLFAALQVFVRDLAAALPQLLMLWMFASPVFYARDSLPPAYRSLLGFNPFTHYPEFFRGALLHTPAPPLASDAIALGGALLVLVIGWALFRRLDPHFEDFL
ncbi:MAG: ABC transporter permease [Xanthomonadaceae bacterium]|nr:ABC transporter permease [Xanthomonadaceae bacterium]